ncbi:MAG: hypothetical protein DUD34_07310 [Lactobacillus sp.]|jgi:hypothetical protein|nr:MAG: hypothetical protein DUD34_07310 [Lactobacillus sp.]
MKSNNNQDITQYPKWFQRFMKINNSWTLLTVAIISGAIGYVFNNAYFYIIAFIAGMVDFVTGVVILVEMPVHIFRNRNRKHR